MSGHGLDFGDVEEGCAVVFEGTVADHEVLGGGVDVAEAALEDVAAMDGGAAGVAEGGSGDIYCLEGYMGGYGAHFCLNVVAWDLPGAGDFVGAFKHFVRNGAGGAQPEVAGPDVAAERFAVCEDDVGGLPRFFLGALSIISSRARRAMPRAMAGCSLATKPGLPMR